jgi:hypothetical protein
MALQLGLQFGRKRTVKRLGQVYVRIRELLLAESPKLGLQRRAARRAKSLKGHVVRFAEVDGRVKKARPGHGRAAREISGAAKR